MSSLERRDSEVIEAKSDSERRRLVVYIRDIILGRGGVSWVL